MWDDVSPILKDFIFALLSGLLTLLSGFLIALAKKGFDWLSAKIDNIKNVTAQNKIKAALSLLEELVKTTVTSLQQTLGDDIKESIKNADGKYTRDDLLKLKDTAIISIKSQLKASTLVLLNSAYENIDILIEDLIEAQVRNLKVFKSDMIGE